MVVRQLERDEVNGIFAALADPTRRDIVARVLRQDASVSALAERYAMSFAAVQLLDQYEEIWRGRLDRLDALLAEPTEGPAR